jgi:pyridoxal phosphate enzyme (YggS family)
VAIGIPLTRATLPGDLKGSLARSLEFKDVPVTAAATIDSRLASVRDDIARACDDAGRAAGSVALVAVSKTFGADAIEPVIGAGQRLFGENRVQEARAKWPALRDRHPGIELHLIGPLQSNKAREAVALFDAIHSLDRPSLAEALAKEIVRQGRAPLLFVEINTGGELQKACVLPEAADDFLKDCRDKYGLTVAGLMCLPPADEPPAPHFALTAKIARRNELNLLSMGMSADFPAAIAMGSTHVRIGTAIFGGRD